MVHPAPAGAAVRAADAAAPVVGRRERKKQATRAALREAALRLSVRHGVENVTVEQIAEEADIALRTFFNYFSSKEEAVVASAASGAEALIAEFRARPRIESVLQAFREAMLIVMDQSDTARRNYIEALRLIRKAPSLVPQQMAVLAAQEKALAEAIAERLGLGPVHPASHQGTASSVYPAVCAAAALAALRVVVDQWLDLATDPARTSSTDLARTSSMAALRLRVDAAIAELAAGLDRPGLATP